jgi:hypothetical protein
MEVVQTDIEYEDSMGIKKSDYVKESDLVASYQD